MISDARAAFRRGNAPRQGISFGFQVRTYVLHPDQRVVDHRTGVQSFDARAVLDGDLDAFMEAELERRADR